MNKYTYFSVTFGCDPEFFFKRSGRVIGSEKILKGVEISGVVIDGVQVELNPQPDTCRQTLSRNIGSCFSRLNQVIKDKENLRVDLSRTVEVTKSQMQSLGDDAKTLGCKPSFNSYKEESKITMEAKKDLKRSAGGHIHLSASQINNSPDKESFIDALDIILGNTCVLLDRDEGNKVRRQVYGRAGEYRLPSHGGIEYRVLSNFWLNHYVLMSLVFGLARTACNLAGTTDTDNQRHHLTILKSLVKMEDIRKAINENDYALAQKNFNKIKGYLVEVTPESQQITWITLSAFEHFYQKGYKYWLPENKNIVEYWAFLDNSVGWENFCEIIKSKI